MSHYFIDKQDPRVADLLRRLENTGKALKKMEPNCQRSFNGERFMNDVELAKLLRISRRTLQEYRSLRILPYYLIQGKVLYKESEIQQLLEEAHRKCLDEQYERNSPIIRIVPLIFIVACLHSLSFPLGLGNNFFFVEVYRPFCRHFT